MQTLSQDIRYALRLLAKNFGFTATTVFTLALGIGATTAIFSVVYGVLLRPLAYHHPEQIVRLWEQNSSGGSMRFADANFEDVQAQNHSLQGAAQYYSAIENVMVGAEASRAAVAHVSRDFLLVMDVQPVLGRSFVPEEQRLNAEPAAMLSYAYWKQVFGGSRDLASFHFKVSNQSTSVVGVLPPGFRFPDGSDIWIPRELTERLPSRSAHNWSVIARLREGTPINQARTELSGIAQRLKQQYGEDTGMVAVTVAPLREAMTADVSSALWILLAASAFLLLIACANVTNLMLAQATAREKELSIRAALGARRSRLIRQFVTESFLLSFVGGLSGVLLAYWGVNVLLALAPRNLPRIEGVSISLPVLVFSLATVLAVSLSLGVFTAVRSLSARETAPLSETARGGIGGVSKRRSAGILAASQLAIALVLLIGAGLLGKSLLRVLSVNSGFRTQGIVTMEVGLPNFPDQSQRIAFLDKLVAQLHQIPGVQEVGGTSDLPLAGSSVSDGSFMPMNPGQIAPSTMALIQRSTTGDFEKDLVLLADLSKWFDELFRDKSRLGQADFVIASDGYFKALNIPLLQGRMFDERDTVDAPHVAVISESLAREKWPGENPLGHSVEFGNMDGDLRLLTIVGVVGDVRDRALESAPVPTLYVNYRQRARVLWDFTVVLQTSGKPEAAVAPARAVLQDLDPTIPPRFRTFSEVYSSSLEARRFSLTLVGVFSMAALLLSLAGIYGVISYSVAQRTREIGVRMALGASTRQVLRMVLQQGATTGAIGIFVGILGSLAFMRWLHSQLFEVSPTDPVTFFAVAALLFLISLLACWIPGRRAARVDPLVALRYE
jgi:putative ABC transport system permease protein